jgi:transposase
MRERVLILLLMNEGRTQEEIAELIGCAQRTVAYWCVHGDPDNIESLEDRTRKREHRKVNQAYIEKLLEVVDKEPSELGYEFGRWTAERLATYLEKETGLKLSGSQVRKILKRKKYAYLWAKYSLEDRQNPEKRKEFKEKFKNYLSISKDNPKLYQIWFWDESGFSLREPIPLIIFC